ERSRACEEIGGDLGDLLAGHTVDPGEVLVEGDVTGQAEFVGEHAAHPGAGALTSEHHGPLDLSLGAGQLLGGDPGLGDLGQLLAADTADLVDLVRPATGVDLAGTDV